MPTINPLAGQGAAAIGMTSGVDRTSGTQGTRATESSLPTTGTGSLDALFEADLPDLPISMRGVSLDQMMKAISDEARRAGIQSAVDGLEVQGDELKAAHEEKLQALKEQIDELSKKSFWSSFCKVFQVIGVVVGAIASVATIAVGALTANPLLIAAGVLGTAMAIDSTLSLATDGKVSLTAGFTELGKVCGMSDEAAQWFGFGMTMGITLISVCVGFGAAGAASGAAKTAEAAANGVAKAAKGLDAMAKISSASNIASGVAGVGTGIGNAVLATVDYKIANLKANSVDIDAVLEQLRSTMKVSQDFIESQMKVAENLMDDVMDIVEDCNATATSLLTAAPTAA